MNPNAKEFVFNPNASTWTPPSFEAPPPPEEKGENKIK